MRAHGMVSGPVECFEARKERTGADGDEGGVVVKIRGGDEFAECVELVVGGGWQEVDRIVLLLCERHGSHVQGVWDSQPELGIGSEDTSTGVGSGVANDGAGELPGRKDYEGIKIYIIARQ